MENQETKKELSIVELKKQHWKSIKKEFIEKIPKQFKVDVKDLESNSSKFYHPIIVLNEEYIIHCQADTDLNYSYAFSLELKNPITIGHFVHTLSININNDEHLSYILNNFEKVEEKLKKAQGEIKKLYEMKESLQKVITTISYNTILEIIDQNQLKQSIRSLEEVTEYLENQRY